MSLTQHHLTCEGEGVQLSCTRHPAGLEVRIESRQLIVQLEELADDGTRLVLRAGDQVISGVVVVSGDRVRVWSDGRVWNLKKGHVAPSGPGSGLSPSIAQNLEAPMTGTVIEVGCKAGEVVEPGTTLVVVEAMKMEHRLTATARLRVAAVETEAGRTVDIGEVLVRFEPPEAAL